MPDSSPIGIYGHEALRPDRASTVETLVADLRETERVLRETIRIEEKTTGLSDHFDVRYSTLARSMRTRADNLKTTIAMLEEAMREAA